MKPAKKPTRRSADATVGGGDNVVSSPSAVHMAFYAMGLRISELMMLDEWIEGHALGQVSVRRTT